tara:strand:- start:1445 stop:2539 length:1095 start_codon:yes stop_codon:yes gene_type:complete
MKIKYVTFVEKNIIFDHDTGLNLIKFLSLNKKKFFIFSMYPNTLYLSLKIFINFTKLLINNSKYKNINKLNFLNFLYIVSFFKTTKPKNILTYLDNSEIVSTIAFNFPDIKIVSIQNGARCNFELENTKLFLDNYYSFSLNEKKLLLSNNSKFRKIIPIGSISAKHFYLKNKNKKKEFDICLVSEGGLESYSELGCSNKLEKKIKKSIDKMNFNLSKYCYESNLKIAICMRRKNENLKLNYQNQFPKNCTIFEKSSKIYDGKTYEIMSKSKIITGFNTTCVRESWGFNKAIYIDYTGTKKLNEISNNEMLIIRNQSYSYLKNKFDYLLSLSKSSYEKKINKYSKNYMVKKSLKLIKLQILKELN